MDVHLSVSSIIILCFFLTILPPSYCDEDDGFVVCSRTYTCGSVNISYPFWGDNRPDYCGGHQGYKLSCHNNEYPVLGFEPLNFRVLNINPSTGIFTIARLDLWDDPCPPKFITTNLNYTLFDYASTVQNVTIFYGCPPPQDNSKPVPNIFVCSPGSVTDGKIHAYYFVNESLLSGEVTQRLKDECNNGSIKVPILESNAIALVEDPQGGVAAVELNEAMKQGFEVEYSNNGLATHCMSCETSGGVCGSNSTQPFLCFCRDQVQSLSCPPKPSMLSLLFSLSWIRLFCSYCSCS